VEILAGKKSRGTSSVLAAQKRIIHQVYEKEAMHKASVLACVRVSIYVDLNGRTSSVGKLERGARRREEEYLV
jgi:hypothetical protein